jgi:hypothetical protein
VTFLIPSKHVSLKIDNVQYHSIDNVYYGLANSQENKEKMQRHLCTKHFSNQDFFRLPCRRCQKEIDASCLTKPFIPHGRLKPRRTDGPMYKLRAVNDA